MIEDKLFTLLKTHKYTDFIQIIKKNIIFDINSKDDSDMYLIQYAILFNKLKIIKILLSLGSKIDYIDNEGKSVLYTPIKLHYNDVIKYIIEFSLSQITIPIVDIYDNNNNISLNYAIIFNNKYAFDLLLKYNSNIDVKDNNGNKPLYYAIIDTKNGLYYLTNLINIEDINYNNKEGKSLLHIAIDYDNFEAVKILIENKININIQDEKYQMTPLIYSFVKYRTDISQYLLNNSNLHIQDYIGNNILHYIIAAKNYDFYKLIDQFIDDKLCNQQNIEGLLPGHLLFIYDFTIIDKILLHSNVNLQDNNGDTILHHIVRKKLWKNSTIESILLNKKNNIFIINRQNKNILDEINKEDQSLFLNIIINSYYNILKNSKIEWYYEWENKCSKSDCLDMIKKQIDKGSSYPLSKESYILYNNIDIQYDTHTNFTTFTGSIIDVIFGLLYLKNTNKTIITGLTKNFKENTDFKNNKIYIVDKTTDYTNFELLWLFNKLWIPTTLTSQIKLFINNNKLKFFIITIGIENSISAHANILIIDKYNKSIERFEPNGSNYPINFNYNPNLLDIDIKSHFMKYFKSYTYYSPIDYHPKIGFQILESIETVSNYKIGDPGGFCLAWCFWYAHMRTTYYNIPINKIIYILIRKIKEKNLSYKTIIRNYIKNITDMRDSIFETIKSDINDYINGQLDDKQINKLENIIKSLV
jgi:ankyrin repeat protein